MVGVHRLASGASIVRLAIRDAQLLSPKRCSSTAYNKGRFLSSSLFKGAPTTQSYDLFERFWFIYWFPEKKKNGGMFFSKSQDIRMLLRKTSHPNSKLPLLSAGPQQDVLIQTALSIRQGGTDLLVASEMPTRRLGRLGLRASWSFQNGKEANMQTNGPVNKQFKPPKKIYSIVVSFGGFPILSKVFQVLTYSQIAAPVANAEFEVPLVVRCDINHHLPQLLRAPKA